MGRCDHGAEDQQAWEKIGGERAGSPTAENIPVRERRWGRLIAEDLHDPKDVVSAPQHQEENELAPTGWLTEKGIRWRRDEGLADICYRIEGSMKIARSI
jgi:hypothetical protein